MSRRGFSLLEVLLALALLAMLSGGIFGFLWNLLDRRDALLQATADAQSAGAFLEMLEADIACAIAGDGASSAGIDGDAERLRILTRRVWAPGAPGEREAAAGDLQSSEYRWDRSSGIVRLSRSPANASGGTVWNDIICERIGTMRFRYFDGQQWATSFDTVQQRQLPVAIEIAMWFGEPLPAEEDEFASPERPEAPSEDERGSTPDLMAGPDPSLEDEFQDEELLPRRSPDRLRIISIADGPTTWWKEAQ